MYYRFFKILFIFQCPWNTFFSNYNFKRFFFFWCGPFFKSLLNLLQYSFCFMFCLLGHEACGILAPQPGIEPPTPCIGRWSPNHGTTREVPVPLHFTPQQEPHFVYLSPGPVLSAGCKMNVREAWLRWGKPFLSVSSSICAHQCVTRSYTHRAPLVSLRQDIWSVDMCQGVTYVISLFPYNHPLGWKFFCSIAHVFIYGLLCARITIWYSCWPSIHSLFFW